ncbi:MAG: DNA polymerase III subunit delta [Phycisphaerae bacterium]|nr:DNA polymerase III subunit delta [Phycisphaerae bacterium]
MSAKSKKPVVPIYAVAGAEPFLKRQAMTRIIDDVLGDADRTLAMSEYDGSSGSAELSSVLDDLRTLPFLTDRRLVLLRDADKFITQHRDALETYAANPSETGVLLIECKTMPATTRLAKQIAKIGELIKCDAPKGYEVSRWVVTHCKAAYSAQIESRAAEKLCHLVGTELGLLDAELQKCLLYAEPRKQINLADVDALVGQQREEQIWNVLDAVCEGNRAKALQLWEEVVQTDRAAEPRAVGGMAFKVRQLLKAKRAQESGVSMDQLMRELWIRDEQQLRRRLDAFTTAQVEKMLAQLLETDVAMKTGMGTVHASIERFIVEFTERHSKRGR